MNRQRRDKLKNAAKLIGEASMIIDSVCSEEEDSMDNYPENLQGTETYERMEGSVDIMNDLMDDLDHAVEKIMSVI